METEKLEEIDKRVNSSIERFERSYQVIIDNNKTISKQLNAIAKSQSKIAIDIAVIKERNEHDRNDILEIKKKGEELEKKVNRTPYLVGAVIGIIATIGNYIGSIFK